MCIASDFFPSITPLIRTNGDCIARAKEAAPTQLLAFRTAEQWPE